jgi:hypothetical protein
MNGKTTGRGLRHAGAVAVAVAVTALAAACSEQTSTQYPSGPAGSVAHQQVVAFVQCLRSHGVLDYKVPPPGDRVAITVPAQNGDGPEAKGIDACTHLLPHGREITSITIG